MNVGVSPGGIAQGPRPLQRQDICAPRPPSAVELLDPGLFRLANPPTGWGLGLGRERETERERGGGLEERESTVHSGKLEQQLLSPAAAAAAAPASPVTSGPAPCVEAPASRALRTCARSSALPISGRFEIETAGQPGQRARRGRGESCRPFRVGQRASGLGSWSKAAGPKSPREPGADGLSRARRCGAVRVRSRSLLALAGLPKQRRFRGVGAVAVES